MCTISSRTFINPSLFQGDLKTIMFHVIIAHLTAVGQFRVRTPAGHSRDFIAKYLCTYL
jgi:hypothetical protein